MAKLTSPPSISPPSDLGFSVTHQISPIPGRSDLFQLRATVTPRLGGQLLGTRDVAERLGISPRSASRLLASGAIRSHRPGLRSRRVFLRDLEAYCRGRGATP